jgi:hypothetical protein
VAINSESCILALPYSNTTFRSTSIKLYFTLTTKIEPLSKESSTKLIALLVKRGKGRLRKNLNISIFLQDNVQF